MIFFTYLISVTLSLHASLMVFKQFFKNSSRSDEFINFGYFLTNFTMFILYIMVDLLTPNSCNKLILPYEFLKNNTLLIGTMLLIIYVYSLIIVPSFLHFSTFSAFYWNLPFLVFLLWWMNSSVPFSLLLTFFFFFNNIFIIIVFSKL